MRRLLPTLLSLLAVLGLTPWQLPVVHAHADGHDPHDHGATRALHAAIHDHGHPHPHPHDPRDHAPEHPDEAPALPPVDGDLPESHAHGSDLEGGLAPARGAGLGSPESRLVSSVEPARFVPGRADADTPAPVPRAGPPRRARHRALDRLIDLGRLLS